METVALSGELDAAHVRQRLHQSTDWFAGDSDDIDIDLSAITRTDSAGLALLLDWLRRARAAQIELTFRDAPPQMRALIDFCALHDILPLS